MATELKIEPIADERKWQRDLNLSNIGTSLEDCRPYRYNKDKAYKEGFEEFLTFSKEVEINGRKWFAHPNINMYIDTTGACNGDCDFCIAKTTFKRTEAPTDKFLKGLERAIELTRHIHPSIQIVGGEPTLSSKVYPILDMVDGNRMRNPVIGTNGTGFNDRLVDRINTSSIQHINLSRHHYNEDLNHEIMHLKPFSPNETFWGNLKNIDPRIDIRLQCNLIGGYIDSYESVIDFVEWSRDHGIHNLVFAQLTPLPRDDMYRSEIIDYVLSRQVDVNAIIESAEVNPEFSFEKYRGGVACYYEVWKYKGDTTVLFKFSDNKYLSMADRTERHLPDLVVHTDGTLCGSWNRNLKILSE
ncbi:hypothetical protein COU53_01825 [Candidatus Pacearchaeota archaeon CG10_big_fil_rev_8_21_14_0_10_30_48]|nr:MAG: hypothetical protein COU53_01825 [Candidatus Pacearchaeota archaeon CG10_big_fil_rev_8_21_14_0_10_30_48]